MLLFTGIEAIWCLDHSDAVLILLQFCLHSYNYILGESKIGRAFKNQSCLKSIQFLLLDGVEFISFFKISIYGQNEFKYLDWKIIKILENICTSDFFCLKFCDVCVYKGVCNNFRANFKVSILQK